MHSTQTCLTIWYRYLFNIQGVSKKTQPLNILRYSYCSYAQNILGSWEFKMASNRTIELLIVISAKLIMVQLTTEQRIYCA